MSGLGGLGNNIGHLDFLRHLPITDSTQNGALVYTPPLSSISTLNGVKDAKKGRNVATGYTPLMILSIMEDAVSSEWNGDLPHFDRNGDFIDWIGQIYCWDQCAVVVIEAFIDSILRNTSDLDHFNTWPEFYRARNGTD